MERWSSRWSWVARVQAYTDHMFRQADVEQQRELRGKIVTREETLEVLTTIVRADPAEVPKLRYSDKVRAIELAGKHHRLFTEQIEVKQSVDVNIEFFEVRAAIHAVVQTEQISEHDAARSDLLSTFLMCRSWQRCCASGQMDQFRLCHIRLATLVLNEQRIHSRRIQWTRHKPAIHLKRLRVHHSMKLKSIK